MVVVSSYCGGTSSTAATTEGDFPSAATTVELHGEAAQALQTFVAGLGTLALAMTGAITLVTDVLFGAAATIVTGTCSLLVFAAFWAVLPLERRFRRADPDPLPHDLESARKADHGSDR